MGHDVFSDPQDQKKIHDQFLIIEQMRDFIEYIFEFEIDYKSQGEVWNEFAEWLTEYLNSKAGKK